MWWTKCVIQIFLVRSCLVITLIKYVKIWKIWFRKIYLLKIHFQKIHFVCWAPIRWSFLAPTWFMENFTKVFRLRVWLSNWLTHQLTWVDFKRYYCIISRNMRLRKTRNIRRKKSRKKKRKHILFIELRKSRKDPRANIIRKEKRCTKRVIRYEQTCYSSTAVFNMWADIILDQTSF